MGLQRSVSSKSAQVADRVSFALILEQADGTFVASSELVFSIAWVHAVDGFAVTWIHHNVIWVRDITESAIDYGIVDSFHRKFVVEIRSHVVSRALHRLTNLWFILSTELCLLSHGFFKCFFLLLIFFHFIVSVAFIQIWVSEHVPA